PSSAERALRCGRSLSSARRDRVITRSSITTLRSVRYGLATTLGCGGGIYGLGVFVTPIVNQTAFVFQILPANGGLAFGLRGRPHDARAIACRDRRCRHRDAVGS